MKNLLSMQRGITMIEVMVSVAIIAIVMAVGVPSLSTWLQNSQVMSTAESVLTGLQLARGEAVRQNNLAQFTLTGNAAGTADWTIVTASSSVPGSFALADGATEIQKAGASEMGANARLMVSSAVIATNCCTNVITTPIDMSAAPKPGVVFNAFGQVVSDPSVTTLSRIDVIKVGDTDANTEEKSRRRVILISPSGSAKLCRPSLPSSNPQGCP
ncbi:MAG: GspH/FimT family pseudopilin [Gallionella sp.]